MPLSEDALKRLAGEWGGYDFWIIRDKHFSTPDELAERFLEIAEPWWQQSTFATHQELRAKRSDAKSLLRGWAEKKLEKMRDSGSAKTLTTHIMFKQLHFGRGLELNFGSTGTNWWKKDQIAAELGRFKPWSVAHAASAFGGQDKLHNRMLALVSASNSPTEVTLYKGWQNSSSSSDRPMLFPQVMGHTSGKFWDKGSRPIHFDFGVVNVAKKAKVLVECDSRKYHSNDTSYTLDRERQNIAETYDWHVLRFTYHQVLNDMPYVLETLKKVTSY